VIEFAYDESLLGFPEAAIMVLHMLPGGGAEFFQPGNPDFLLDTVNDRVRVRVASLSPFILGFPKSSTWVFAGTAQGGTIDFEVADVTLQIVTTLGMTSDQVAAAIAAAINADATLARGGLTLLAGALVALALVARRRRA